MNINEQQSNECHEGQEIQMVDSQCCDDGMQEAGDAQPNSWSFTVTLQGNGGFINGASSVEMNLASPIAVGNLPNPTPAARFLGWSHAPTGQVLPPQMLIDSNERVYARFAATPAHYNQMTRSELAQEIMHRHMGRSLSNRHILLSTQFGNVANRTTTVCNIRDTAAGLPASRPPMSGGTPSEPIGGTIPICENLLRAILRISDHYYDPSRGPIQINSFAGARHYRYSRHYGTHRNAPNLCIAADIRRDGDIVRGTGVSLEDVLDFLEDDWGFRTQRNVQPAPPDRDNYVSDGVLHLEIWGRS